MKTKIISGTYTNWLNIIYISIISDTEVKSKINKIFKNYNPFEEYSVKMYKIEPYFYKQYEKHTQVNDQKRKYTLFKTDIYFSEYSLVVEIDKKGVDRDLIFEIKRQKVLEKNSTVNLLELIKIMI